MAARRLRQIGSSPLGFATITSCAEMLPRLLMLAAGPCGTTLATAFGSDHWSVDMLRSSLRSPNLTTSSQAHLARELS